MTNRIFEKVEISSEQISHIFNKKLGLRVIDSLFMSDGGSTTNYKVITPCGSYLLKLYPTHRDNSAEIHLMKSLESVIKLPKVHLYDFSREQFLTDFLISDFIEGHTFRNYVQVHGISKEHAWKIGETLSTIQSKTYKTPHSFEQENKPVKSIIEQYHYFINSYAGRHIGHEYCQMLKEIVSKNHSELACVNNKTVRTHGDLNPSNIIVDHNQELWFIDFEYGHATTPYLDFGKLLRKRNDFSSYLTSEVLEHIKSSYKYQLPDNWVHLSMLVDIPALLRMIDNNSPNKWRVEYIKRRIHDLHLDLDKFTYTFVPD